MFIGFAKKKFLSLSLRQQHKKCADLLKYCYDELLMHLSISNLIIEYNKMQEWMGMDTSTLSSPSFEMLSNRYHEHLALAQCSLKEHHLLTNIICKDRHYTEDILPIAIYLDNLRSAHNVGSILRTTEALALGTVFFSERTPYIDHQQVKNTSKNAYLHVTCKKDTQLKDLPRPFIALETSKDAHSIHNFIFPQQFTLIIGNEEYGCSEQSLKLSDHLLIIPMRGRKNSLNVANAFSMAAHEIIRQRQR